MLRRRNLCLLFAFHWIALDACYLAAQEDRKPKIAADKLILPGETFVVDGRTAFVLLPEESKRSTPQPWILYAPTLLPQYPDSHEKWMHEQFLAAGIAVAGVDAGEAYGSPDGNHAIDALYDELVKQRKFAAKPALLVEAAAVFGSAVGL